jgi:hypothetical protein
MLPKVAVHVTVSSVAVAATVAENCSVPPIVAEGELGVIVTEVTAEPPWWYASGDASGFVSQPTRRIPISKTRSS